jgi:hypothetical protein
MMVVVVVAVADAKAAAMVAAAKLETAAATAATSDGAACCNAQGADGQDHSESGGESSHRSSPRVERVKGFWSTRRRFASTLHPLLRAVGRLLQKMARIPKIDENTREKGVIHPSEPGRPRPRTPGPKHAATETMADHSIVVFARDR